MKLFQLLMLFNINHPEYYKIHPDIHLLGNHGFSGKIHASIAPIATKLIDIFGYNGMDVRNEIIKNYDDDTTVLDLCCGTGFSTPSQKNSYGIDNSIPMIEKAQKLWCKSKNFQYGDAENYYNPVPFDIVQIFFAFHEIPQHGRKKIIDNAIKNARKEVIILDISPEYKPSNLMLFGEPYIEEYLENIDDDLKNFDKHYIIKEKVNMWKLNL